MIACLENFLFLFIDYMSIGENSLEYIPSLDLSCTVYLFHGIAGPVGPTGPQGPVCETNNQIISMNSRTFITTYSCREQQILINSAIEFDDVESCNGDCFCSPKSSEIWIWRTGFYQIYTNFYHIEPCQFSVYKNSNIIPCSTIGSLAGTSQNTTTFITQIMNDDLMIPCAKSPSGLACKLELKNNTISMPYITIPGSPSIGNIIPQITATMTVLQIV